MRSEGDFAYRALPSGTEISCLPQKNSEAGIDAFFCRFRDRRPSLAWQPRGVIAVAHCYQGMAVECLELRLLQEFLARPVARLAFSEQEQAMPGEARGEVGIMQYHNQRLAPLF